MSMGRYENLHVGMSGSIVLNQCCQYNLIRRDMIPAKPAPHETTGRRATTLHSAELGSINCNSNSNNSESMGRERVAGEGGRDAQATDMPTNERVCAKTNECI